MQMLSTCGPVGVGVAAGSEGVAVAEGAPKLHADRNARTRNERMKPLRDFDIARLYKADPRETPHARIAAMNSSQPFYICVDIETAGPNPADYALLSIGAVVVDQPAQIFYAELKPDRDQITEESFSVHQLSLESLAASGQPPAQALQAFVDWVETQANGRAPIFVAFNAAFDWMFVQDYLQRYLGQNPFGHRALDMKALFMGLTGTAWDQTTYQNVSRHYGQPEALGHNALQDAQQGAALFAAILADLKEKV